MLRWVEKTEEKQMLLKLRTEWSGKDSISQFCEWLGTLSIVQAKDHKLLPQEQQGKGWNWCSASSKYGIFWPHLKWSSTALILFNLAYTPQRK